VPEAAFRYQTTGIRYQLLTDPRSPIPDPWPLSSGRRIARSGRPTSRSRPSKG